jgi:hypothetical protein
VFAWNRRNESVIYWIIGITDTRKVITNCAIVGSLNPVTAKVIEKPLIALIAVRVVVISYEYAKNLISIV